MLSFYPCLHFIRCEYRYGPPVTDTRSSLQGVPVDSLDVMVNAGSIIEVESGEVELSNIARIVHVSEKDVHILGGAKAWKMHKKF